MNVNKLNHWGESITITPYIKAYEDFSFALEHLRNIIYNIEVIDGWEKNIAKYRKDKDYDIDEVKEEIGRYEEKLELELNELREEIERRTKERWA